MTPAALVAAARLAADAMEPVAIAVVDSSCSPVLILRPSGLRTEVGQASLDRAVTARLLRRPTGHPFGPGVDDAIALAAAQIGASLTAEAGGLPILGNEGIVGAVGISGANDATNVALATKVAYVLRRDAFADHAAH